MSVALEAPSGDAGTDGRHGDDVGPPPLETGRPVADGYVAIALLRRGSSYDVYEAWSTRLHCRCVVKVVRPHRVGEVRLRRHLLAEGRIMLRLAHPHLQRAYEVRAEPALIASQTITGPTLNHVLDGRPRLGAPDLAVIGSQLTSAVAYLHGLGYLHRDVKPGNVMLEDGMVRLIDFGLARRPGRVAPGIGTPGYCSPEQAAGGWIGPPTDVWGIGATIYKAVAGRRPFAETYDALGRLSQVLGTPDPVRSVRPRLPRALAALVDACLRHDPASRPSLDEVQARFDALSAEGPPVVVAG